MFVQEAEAFKIFLNSGHYILGVIIYFNYSRFWSLSSSKCSVGHHGNQRKHWQVLSIFSIQNPPADLTIKYWRPRQELG